MEKDNFKNESENLEKAERSVFSFNWISIYIQKPMEGQKVASRIANEKGFVGECVYTNGYFETYKDHRNRMEIIRWKHDEWAVI